MSTYHADFGFALYHGPTVEARSPKFTVDDHSAFRFERYLNGPDCAHHFKLSTG